MMFKIGIISGKGGTGKTTIAIALAKRLAESYPVALVDLDIQMLNIQDELGGEIGVKQDKLIPARLGNLEYIFYDATKKSQICWDYGDYSSVAHQLITRVQWNNPEYMILDLPPGIEEVSRRLLPECDTTILVIQPHLYSISNAHRIVEFCRDEEIPMSGIIINFAGFNCPSCGAKINLGEHELYFDVPIISRIPFIPDANVDEIEKYIDPAVKNALDNPIRLNKKTKILSKVLKKMIDKGF